MCNNTCLLPNVAHDDMSPWQADLWHWNTSLILNTSETIPGVPYAQARNIIHYDSLVWDVTNNRQHSTLQQEMISFCTNDKQSVFCSTGYWTHHWVTLARPINVVKAKIDKETDGRKIGYSYSWKGIHHIYQCCCWIHIWSKLAMKKVCVSVIEHVSLFRNHSEETVKFRMPTMSWQLTMILHLKRWL